MVRCWYYVVDNGGEWEIRTSEAENLTPRLRFADQDAAIEAACKMARDEWRTTLALTGVRVPISIGGWHDECTFGVDPSNAPA